MKKRINEIKVRLSDNELSSFTDRAKECGYSREAYIRSLLDGRIPQPMPPPDYHAMLNELRAIGTNMNQIAQKAHVLNVIDTQRYEAAYTALKQALVEIIKAVTQPRKIERKNTGPPQSAKALRGEEQPRSGEPLDACGESDKRGEL